MRLMKVDQMIGHSIDMFHKHPEHQRGLVADPRNLPRTAMIQVGPEQFELTICPMTDRHGRYIGPVVTVVLVTGPQEAKVRATGQPATPCGGPALARLSSCCPVFRWMGWRIGLARADLPVVDFSNLSQNVLTAARTLDAVNNQIIQLQHEVTMLQNEARNLTSLPFNIVGQLRATLARTTALIKQAQGNAYQLAQARAPFDHGYPVNYTASRTGAPMFRGPDPPPYPRQRRSFRCRVMNG